MVLIFKGHVETMVNDFVLRDLGTGNAPNSPSACGPVLHEEEAVYAAWPASPMRAWELRASSTSVRPFVKRLARVRSWWPAQSGSHNNPIAPKECGGSVQADVGSLLRGLGLALLTVSSASSGPSG